MTTIQDPTHPTGVTSDDRGGKELARSRSRKANSAVQLRAYGATWDEVAEILGYPTGQSAQVATEKALENELRTPETKAFMRKLLSDQMEKLLKSVMPKATDSLTDNDGNKVDNPEHLAYVDRALRIIDRKAKLWGVDAPTEFVVTNPSVAEIERWVSEVSASDIPEVDEGDIFGDDTVVGEVVEDAVPAQ